jgi:hypothetical protein
LKGSLESLSFEIVFELQGIQLGFLWFCEIISRSLRRGGSERNLILRLVVDAVPLSDDPSEDLAMVGASW